MFGAPLLRCGQAGIKASNAAPMEPARLATGVSSCVRAFAGREVSAGVLSGEAGLAANELAGWWRAFAGEPAPAGVSGAPPAAARAGGIRPTRRRRRGP